MILAFLAKIDLATIIIFITSYFIFGIATFKLSCWLIYVEEPNNDKFNKVDVIAIVVLWPIIAIIMIATSGLLLIEWLPNKIIELIRKLITRK